jgi:PLP dependent protein
MDAHILRENLAEVRSRVEQAARDAGRDPEEVRLIVVTKTHPAQVIRLLADEGVKHIGESYVEEALPKIEETRDLPDLQWHMVGHVQSRKARNVVENFHYLHSLDRIKLARLLDKRIEKPTTKLPVLLECNVSGEDTKFGWQAWKEEHWQDLIPQIEEVLEFPNIEVKGLMTMAPFLPDPELARPYFRKLRLLRDYLANRFPESSWGELSMGMSGDFEAAVLEGATWIRVGSAILGERKTRQQ